MANSQSGTPRTRVNPSTPVGPDGVDMDNNRGMVDDFPAPSPPGDRAIRSGGTMPGENRSGQHVRKAPSTKRVV